MRKFIRWFLVVALVFIISGIGYTAIPKVGDMGDFTISAAGKIMRLKDYVVHDVWVDSTPASDHTGDAIWMLVEGGEAIAIGEAVYVTSSTGVTAPVVYKCDATTADGKIGKRPLLAMSAITDGGTGYALVYGVARDDSWNWTRGGEIYLSATTGALTQTDPTGAGNTTKSLGYAIGADQLFWFPGDSATAH